MPVLLAYRRGCAGAGAPAGGWGIGEAQEIVRPDPEGFREAHHGISPDPRLLALLQVGEIILPDPRGADEVLL
jgi:hypothetical protein